MKLEQLTNKSTTSIYYFLPKSYKRIALKNKIIIEHNGKYYCKTDGYECEVIII